VIHDGIIISAHNSPYNVRPIDRMEWDRYFGEDVPLDEGGYDLEYKDAEYNNFINTISTLPSLEKYLEWQICFNFFEKSIFNILKY
jgi:hypothetical protein